LSTFLLFGGGLVAWLIGWVALGIGALTRRGRGRAMFAAAALLQCVAGPLALGVAVVGAQSSLAVYGMEAQWPIAIDAVAAAGCLGWGMIAVSDVLVALGRHRDGTS